MTSKRWLLYLSLTVFLPLGSRSAFGHEGHQPLPSKGASVDLEKGIITLSPDARRALDVQLTEAKQRVVADKLLAYARLVTPWDRRAFVTSRLTGRIARLLVQAGQSVAVDETLAEVESVGSENLQLELISAHNEQTLNGQIRTRLEAGVRGGSATGAQLESQRAAERESQSKFEIAREKCRSVGLSEEQIRDLLAEGPAKLVRRLSIRSPIAGTVAHADLTVGKIVDPTEHLFEVVNLDRLWIRLEVVEHDLVRVRNHSRVELTLAAFPKEILTASLSPLPASFDASANVGVLWSEIANHPGSRARYLPGMYGQAQLVEGGAAALAIANTAIVAQGVEHFVFVEQTATAKGFQYQKRNVVLGRRSGGFVEIVGGEVYPGDRIVDAGSHELASFFVASSLRPSAEAVASIGLRLAPLGKHSIAELIEVDGAVDLPPGRRAAASSPLSGSIRRLYVDRGQTVHAGQILAELHSVELQTMQLDLLSADLRGQFLNEQLTRLRSLDQSGVLARQRVWEVESEALTTRHRQEVLVRKLETIGLGLPQIADLRSRRALVDVLPIRAPIDGILMEFDRALGQAVRAEETVFQIHDSHHTLVRAFISESDLPHVAVGQRARMRFVAAPDVALEGRVVRSGDVFGELDRTLSVWVAIDAEPPLTLLHGMLARVSLIASESQPTLALPRRAVAAEGNRTFVFVRKEDGGFERRPVQLGAADDRFVEVRGGMTEGERIAVEGVAELQTGYAAVR